MSLDATDRQILNALQDGFPICPDPFLKVARDLGLSEDDLLARLARMAPVLVLVTVVMAWPQQLPEPA